MAFTEDLSDFINDDTPGYVLATLDGVDVAGIFDSGTASGLNNMMLGTNPTFTCTKADSEKYSSLSGYSTVEKAMDPRGKTLVVNSVSYTVRESKPDGTGMTVLELEKA